MQVMSGSGSSSSGGGTSWLAIASSAGGDGSIKGMEKGHSREDVGLMGTGDPEQQQHHHHHHHY